MKKSRFNQRIEIEKKKILDDYNKLLRDHERDEQVRLNKDIEDYKKELQEKLEEEKRVILF